VRVVAGDVGDRRGPGATHTPITFVHATVAPGARLQLPWRADFNALVYVLSGRGRLGDESRPVEAGQLAVLGAGDHVEIAAADAGGSGAGPLEVIVLGGQPLREPVAWYGPFVMNTRDEVVAALEDFQAGRFGAIPPDALRPTSQRSR
jgi:redox-sensitive bicupin YhaK (pirin superfamily)